MEILTAKDLSFTYAKSNTPALDNVSFSVHDGRFVTVCGPTGSGKSTLLRLLKKEIAPKGEQTGQILFRGKPLSELSERESAEQIGCVVQHPEEQIVSDRVSGELFFGAESLGYPRQKAYRRAAEAASFFNLTDRFSDKTAELSGGQKQLLALASVLVTSPKLILLDEPTSRLDPVAAADFISMLARINRQLGITVIIAEHNTSLLLEYTDTLMFLEGGKLTACGAPDEVLSKKPSEKVLSDMPAPVRMFFEKEISGKCPLTVKEGRLLFQDIKETQADKKAPDGDDALELKNVFFRYKRDSKDILKGVDLTVKKGEIRFIFGGNGCGKTTLLQCCAGLLKPYSGKTEIFGKKITSYKNGELYTGCVAMLCQDAHAVFTHETIGAEFKGFDIKELPYDISPIIDRHPYDVSGGELQMAALCRVLLSKPRLILLDEPTKGMDAAVKKIFTDVLFKLKEQGVSVVIASHDTELAAQCADTCSMMFDGQIVCSSDVAEFMRGNSFYTTDKCRMTGGRLI